MPSYHIIFVSTISEDIDVSFHVTVVAPPSREAAIMRATYLCYVHMREGTHRGFGYEWRLDSIEEID